ncbi:arylsulfatase [Lacticaseibacillus paracasei]|nr:arylsulfatase [Lacticaseibacillus paracasei]
MRELKQKLISYLFNREERFVKEGRLKPVSVENIKSTLNSPLAGKDGLNEI